MYETNCIFILDIGTLYVRFYNLAAIVVAMNKIFKETYNVKKYTRTSARIVNQ